MMCFCLSAEAQTENRYKPFADSVGQYLVKYEIDTSLVSFENQSGRHYEAVITVLEIDGSDTSQVYQPLRGIYAENDCVCDDPKKLVDRFRKLNNAEK